MRTRTINKSVYICENCGAEHSVAGNIKVDNTYGTGMEYCTKCAVEVMLSNTDIFGVENISDDIGCHRAKVPPKAIQCTELDMELDYCDYKRKIYQAMVLYGNLVKRIDKEFLAGKVRDMKIPTIDEILT